tara:strand:- start:77 stop:289 length:213 start_codon:yes stop_codon:yes gene_type:complete
VVAVVVLVQLELILHQLLVEMVELEEQAALQVLLLVEAEAAVELEKLPKELHPMEAELELLLIMWGPLEQ